MLKKIALLCLLAFLCTVNICAAQSAQQGFASNFHNTVIYDLNGLIAAFDGLHGNGEGQLDAAEEREFSFANCYIDVGDMELKAYCYNAAPGHYGKLEFVGARVMKPSYKVAGLKLGDSFSEKEAAAFSHNMQAMGWKTKGDAVPIAYRWEQMLSDRSLEFCIRTKNNRIVDINWLQYLKVREHDCN